MKSLVLLYQDNHDDTLHIKCYSQVRDNKDVYIVGERRYGFLQGVSKKLIGIPSDYRTNYYAQSATTLPYMGECYLYGGKFLFVNKNKYDEDPLFYQDIIKNFRVE